jgi:tetratricopeptide (TPR) repeat protein
MLERRAVTKIRQCVCILAIQLIFIFVSGPFVVQWDAHAQTTNKKNNKATKKSKKPSKPSAKVAAENESRSKTVGDILNKIEKKAEQVKLLKGQSTLPKIQKNESQEVGAVNLRSVKPPQSTKLYYEEGTDERELEQVLDEGIAQLFELAKRSAKSSKRGELWLRLAELYAEKARFIEFKILKEHDKKLELMQEGKLKTRPKLDLEPSIAYNKKAIQLYEWFLRDFPKDPKVDQALFFLGFNHFEIGDAKKGETYYARLTKEFPKSPYVHESNFALGEYHFEAERWKLALPYYEKVSLHKNNRLYSFAMYKMAWCLYKLNQTNKGLNFLEVVILEGRKIKSETKETSSGVSRIRLASEAIKDLILFYAEVGDPNKARAYFEEIVGPKSANANLAKLAYFYSDSGSRNSGRILFRDLIEQDPNSIKAYDYQYAIVKMYGASGDPSIFQKELYDWIQQYGPDSSWHKQHEKDKEAVAKANELMETLLRNYVLQQHQTAQNAKTKTARAKARSGYDLYFSTFNNSKRLDEMRFFHGELLFDIGDYAAAAQNYEWVTEKDPDSVYYKKALINTLLSYEKRLPTDAQVRKLVGNSTDPLEFTPEIVAFEKASSSYFRKDPEAKDNGAVKYRMGALHYLFNQFEPAIKIFNYIIEKYPATPFAKYSANHLLDIYNIRKDYTGLMQAADNILARPELASTDLGAQVKDIKLRTDLKFAKDLEDEKDYLGAAKSYEQFAKKNASSEFARPAKFNAAVNYERSGFVATAIAYYVAIANDKTKTKDNLSERAKQFLPSLYEKTGQYQKAAALFEELARINPKNSKSIGYIFNAAIIYDGLNLYTAATRNYENYLELNKKGDRAEALFLLGKLYERRGLADKAISFYDQYLNASGSDSAGIVESAYRIAMLHTQLKRKKVAEEWYGKVINIQKSVARRSGKNAGASYAAECKFLLAKNTYNEFQGIFIPKLAKNQKNAFDQKILILNRLKNELKNVILYDDGRYIVAALSMQGEALENMYKAFITAAPPAGLNADELAQYKEGIKKQLADPFLEQAKEAYKAAIDRGYQLQAYSNSLVEAVENYARITNDLNKSLPVEVMLTELVDRGSQ